MMDPPQATWGQPPPAVQPSAARRRLSSCRLQNRVRARLQEPALVSRSPERSRRGPRVARRRGGVERGRHRSLHPDSFIAAPTDIEAAHACYNPPTSPPSPRQERPCVESERYCVSPPPSAP